MWRNGQRSLNNLYLINHKYFFLQPSKNDIFVLFSGAKAINSLTVQKYACCLETLLILGLKTLLWQKCQNFLMVGEKIVTIFWWFEKIVYYIIRIKSAYFFPYDIYYFFSNHQKIFTIFSPTIKKFWHFCQSSFFNPRIKSVSKQQAYFCTVRELMAFAPENSTKMSTFFDGWRKR